MIAWIRSYLGASKKLLAQVLVLGVIAVVFAIGLMFVAGYLIAASADNAFSLLMLNIPLAFVQIFGLGKPLARYLELPAEPRLGLEGHFNIAPSFVQGGATPAARTGALANGRRARFARKRYRTRPESVLSAAFFRCSIAWIVGVLLVAVAASCRQACCCSRSSRSFC